MKKFKFRLQTLLDQRKAKEDRFLLELGEIRREEALELARLAELESHKVITLERYNVARSQHCDVTTLGHYDSYLQTLRDDIKVQHLTIEAVRERFEAKRVEVTEAMKERKVIETLRDKQEREYISAQLRAEQNALDEMASLRFARGM